MRVVLSYLGSDPVSLEAGFKDWFRGLLARIPGLPSKQEALKTVGEFLQRAPAKFEGAVKEIFSILQSAGREQFNLRAALDMHSFLRGVKTVTNPKVILAIIALMGIFQTADAGEISKQIQKSQQEQQVGHVIIVNEFTLLGTTRIDVRVVDERSVVVEAKGFDGQNKDQVKKQADDFIKQLQGKYPGSKVMQEK